VAPHVEVSLTYSVAQWCTLWCWGWNGFGQLGDGTTTERHEPTRIGTATNWSAVFGGNHTIGLRNSARRCSAPTRRESSSRGDASRSRDRDREFEYALPWCSPGMATRDVWGWRSHARLLLR